MGFYGTTSSSAKTNLLIDRTYPNRVTMESNKSSDGVYSGRYVLIEYDGIDAIFLITNPVYRSDKKPYNFSYNYSNISENDFLPLEMTVYYVVPASDYNIWLTEPAKYNYEIWMINPRTKNFEIIDNDNSHYTSYTTNYNIDKKQWPEAGRGWDSTLWQKVYVNSLPDYVMVAELNSVIPTFGVTVDAPSELPTAPHFDDSHTNIYYDIHLQPQWGFRIAPAKNNAPSDETGSYLERTYNTLNLYDPSEDKIIEKPQNIYYNRAGFDSENIITSNLEDIVTLEPSGRSGMYYNNHGTDPTKDTVSQKNDIQELSIILPSLGNTISKVWDIVYPIHPTETNKRNKIIDWDETEENKGGRFIVPTGNGYSLSKENIATLAGCINSVHDLMGRIIKDETNSISLANDNINSYDKNLIYYFSKDDIKKFYRKAPTYIWDEEHLIEYNYKEITLTINTYEPNVFFYKDSETGKMIKAEGDFNESLKPYYVRLVVMSDTGYVKAGDAEGILLDYEEDTYYNEIGNNYIISTSLIHQNAFDYFKITSEGIDLSAEYAPGRYYYFNNDGNFVKDMSTSVSIGREYYSYLKGLEGSTEYRYKPNTYYYIDGKNYIIDTNASITEGREYFRQINKGDLAIEGNLEKVIVLQPGDENGLNYYYSGDDINVVKNEDITSDLKYFTNLAKTGPLMLYTSNTYYYLKDGSKDYLLDTSKFYTANRKYYILEKEKVTPFYEANKYYYLDKNNEYVLDQNNAVTKDRIYYEKDSYYVKSDSENIYRIGAEWNSNVINVPASIELGKYDRSRMYEMKELEEFAQSYNTIHGLILRINELLEYGDIRNRDTETVQGCINTVNDIINKFDELIPGSINIVDYLGRVSCAELIGDTWIGTKVDDVNKDITINHLEANEAILYHQIITDISPNFNESFDIPYIGFDAKGHASDFGSVKTITLPKMTLLSDGAENGNVVTKITLSDNYDTLTQTLIDVGNLTLQTYNHSVSSESVASDLIITTNDTLNSALSKLQDQAIINAEDITSLEDRVTKLDGENGRVAILEGRVDALENEFTETGRIGVLESKVATNISTIDNHNTRISTLEEKVGDKSVADSIASALNNISVSNNGTSLNGLQAILDNYLARIIALENIPVID